MSRWYYVVCMYNRCLDDILFYCTLYVFLIDILIIYIIYIYNNDILLYCTLYVCIIDV